ncbi:MAG TPA: hypothetical protein VF157_09750, partial [Chloroflexota bacterium]
MRIEKYHAEDMQEAFRLIKAELGADAVVIQTRKVRLGLFGWFRKPVYEVIAAVDEEVLRPPKLSAAAAGASRVLSSEFRVQSSASSPAPMSPKPARAQAAYAAKPRPNTAAQAAPKPTFRAASPIATNGATVPRAEGEAENSELRTQNAELETPVKLESSDVALLREMKHNMLDLKTAMNRLSKQAQFGNIANFSSVLVNV